MFCALKLFFSLSQVLARIFLCLLRKEIKKNLRKKNRQDSCFFLDDDDERRLCSITIILLFDKNWRDFNWTEFLINRIAVYSTEDWVWRLKKKIHFPNFLMISLKKKFQFNTIQHNKTECSCCVACWKIKTSLIVKFSIIFNDHRCKLPHSAISFTFWKQKFQFHRWAFGEKCCSCHR